MRSSEWISVGFLGLFLFQALVRSRISVVILSAIGFLLIWIGLRYPALRDWIPVLLMLIIYREGGAFYTKPNEKLQNYLERFERKISLLHRIRSHDFWEAAYFLCYPLVPAAVLTLKFIGQSSRIDFFWMIVLPPTYACHIIVSFFPSLPPWNSRKLEFNRLSRKLNWLVVQHLSNKINTFPSAHVAASVAIALAMLHLNWIAGFVFSFLALSITISTIVGRYHYTADALWGIVVAVFWYFFLAFLAPWRFY